MSFDIGSMMAPGMALTSAQKMTATGGALAAGGSVLGGGIGLLNGINASSAASSNADAAMAQANAQAVRLARFRAQQLGTERAQYGASGVTRDGSPLDQLANDAISAKEDVMLTKYAGKVQASSFKNQARASMFGGFSAGFGGLASGAGTILGTRAKLGYSG